MVGWQSSLGIYLGRKRTTFVEVQSFLGQVRVIESGVVDVDSGQVLERLSADPTRKREGRRSLKGARVDHVVVGLTSQQTVSRVVDLPNVDDERLAGLLAYEIERHLPFPLGEACYGFQKVSTSGATARVLITAAKRTDVEFALAKIERLGLVPTLMDVSSAAIAAAVSFRVPSHLNRMIGVVRLEDAEATVDLVQNGILMSSRTIHAVQDSDATEGRSSSKSLSDGSKAQGPPGLGMRVPVEGYVTFSCDQLCGEGTVVNLSRKGLCVRADEPLELGQSLRLSIAFQEMNDSLEVPMAKVRWTTGRMHGLETVIVDNDVRARVQRYLPERQQGYRFPSASLEHMAAVNRVTTDEVASPEAYRHALEGYVAFSGGGIEGEGVVVEGSEAGCRIRSSQPVKVGMVLTLNIALPELDDPVEVAQAKVRWTRTGEFGVQVEGDGGAIRSALQRCVRPSRVSKNEPRGDANLAEAVLAEFRRLASLPIGLPERVFLYGGSDDMSRTVQLESGIAVEQWNEIAPGIDPVALGLALRGLKTNEQRLDLLPPERRIVSRDRTAVIFSALLVCVVILAAGWWGSRAMLERTLLAQLEEDITKVMPKAERVSALQKEFTALHTRMQVLEKLALSQGRSMNLLKEVVLLLPPDVLLQEFTLDGTKVRLRGSTGASAAALISAFEQSALLENAAFTAPISVQGKDRQAFEIAATIRALSPAAPVNREGKRPS